MKLYTFFGLLLLSFIGYSQDNIGIGTTTPHNSAVLDITANSKGLLIPRVTSSNRPANPATGLLIYQTDNTPGFYYFNGTSWAMLTAGGLNGSGNSNQIPFFNSTNSVTGSNNLVWNNNNNRLGINNNNPASSLHILSVDYINTKLESTHPVGAGINLQASNNSSYTLLATNSGAGAGANKFGVYDEAAGAYRMVIDANGKMGIGNVNPSALLDVNGAGGLKVSTTTDGSFTTDWIAANFGGSVGNRVVAGLLEGRATIGAHSNALNAWANLSINPGGGNVSIGHQNPQQTLDVNGTIRASSLAGTNNRMVIANASGDLLTQDIPTGADNLGNHTATQNLNLSNNKLVGNNGTNGLLLSNDGAVTINNLAGTGDRMVIANADGTLSSQAIPTGGDNLGNHTATTAIQLNNNWLSNNGSNKGIRIDNDGKTGINISNPQGLLDVGKPFFNFSGTYTNNIAPNAIDKFAGTVTNNLTADKAFDNSTATYTQPSNYNAAVFVGVDFGENNKKYIRRVGWNCDFDSYQKCRGEFILMASNDNVNYTTIFATGLYESFTANGDMSYPETNINNNTAYRFYRLYLVVNTAQKFTTTSGGYWGPVFFGSTNNLRMRELYLFEENYQSGFNSGAFTVLENGNTGIGTATPTANLDVTGTVRFRNGAAANSVLVSDANGNATWSNASPLRHFSQTFTVPNATYPFIVSAGPTTPTYGESNIVWTHNFGYQPVLMLTIQQDANGYCEFVKVVYEHINNNQTRFRFSNTSVNPASGTLRILVVN